MNDHTINNSRHSQLVDNWTFDWPILETILGGRSSIDLKKMILKSSDEAVSFLCTYGYDVNDPDDKRHLEKIHIEAIHFIAEHLMPKEWKRGLRPPQEFIQQTNMIEMLLAASNSDGSPHRQNWACSILRVMHTIAHLDELERLRLIQCAREQILKRFEQACERDEAGILWLQNEGERIEIIRLELKVRKSRRSMLLKLLHKPANVADTVYDLLGIRIITKTVSESILAVKFLHRSGLVSFANTNPMRVRNTLIRIEEFRTQLETLLQLFENKVIGQRQFITMVAEIGRSGANTHSRENPHSANAFQSIQMTGRQRITVEEPASIWLDKMAGLLEGPNQLSTDASNIIKHFSNFLETFDWALKPKTYFPFEIQIIDATTASAIQSGSASHDCYKKAQIRTARRRVLHSILRTKA